MKKRYSTLAFTLLCFLMLGTHLTSFAQKKVNGNGNVTTVEHEVGSFDELRLKGIFNVFLHHGSSESVKVVADENLHRYVDIENDGGILEIDNKPRINIGKKNKMEIHITFSNVKKMKLGGVGNIQTGNALKMDKLDLIISSVGNVELELECNDLFAEMNSVGNVSLSGKIKNVEIDNRSVGRLGAYDLEVDYLKLYARGVGGTEVYAAKEMSLDASGIGNVHYRGDAVITHLKTSGLGKVKKMD